MLLAPERKVTPLINKGDPFEELVRAKRARPVTSVERLMAPGLFASDDEVHEFVAAVREWRQAELG